MGLIKTLCVEKTMMGMSLEETRRLVEPQKDISFDQTKDLVREANYNLYKKIERDMTYSPMTVTNNEVTLHDSISLNKEDIINYENILMDTKILDKIYEQNKNNYSPQKIFLFHKPTMEKIIKYYVEDNNILIDAKPVKIIGSKDVKIFYLFSNVDQDRKCIYQYKLFENTLGLMKIIDNVNIQVS